MHDLDPFAPIFSPSDVVSCTSLDKFSVQNYISAGHAQPSKIGNRRVFTALQMIHMEIVAQLAGLFNIPPSTGNKLAGELVMQMPQGWLALDARTVQQSRAWINSATDHGLVEYRRSDDGTVTNEPGPDSVTISFPVRLMARQVLARAHAVLNGAE